MLVHLSSYKAAEHKKRKLNLIVSKHHITDMSQTRRPSFEEKHYLLTLGGKSYPNYMTFIFTPTVTLYMKSDFCLHYQDVKVNALPSKELFELSDN